MGLKKIPVVSKKGMSSQQFPMQEYCKIDKTKNFCTYKQVGLTKECADVVSSDALYCACYQLLFGL